MGKTAAHRSPSHQTFAEIKVPPVHAGHNPSTLRPAPALAHSRWNFMTRLPLVLLACSIGVAASALAFSAAAQAPAKRDMSDLHSGVSIPADVGDVKVAKASGPDARTVAEILKGKGDLKDKPVVVRGKIVKYTPGVMGKNWMHLQDGSGSAKDGTNDIVVTTLDEAKRGDVVLLKGVVRVDRDLGSGYFYKVLVEDAKLQ
jgi:hypothetical protein